MTETFTLEQVIELLTAIEREALLRGQYVRTVIRDVAQAELGIEIFTEPLEKRGDEPFLRTKP